jgi:WD40 repeat protein
MHDVFVSYSRRDRKRIGRLVDVLIGQRGWSIWFDEALRAGDQFPQVIQSALAEVRCVLVVWSRDAVESRWVVAEASEGWGRGILVPIRLDDAEPPMPFRQTEATDFSAWTGSPGAPPVLKLIEAIDRTLLKGPQAAEAELLAREGRRRAYRRRRLIRRAAIAGAGILLVGAGGLGWQQWQHRGSADRLADRATELRAEVLHLSDEERHRTWGSVLLDTPERIDRLEVATLLAIEAVRRARTDHTRQVLDELIAMSPWSDAQLELEDEVYEIRMSADGGVVVAGGGHGDTIVWQPSTAHTAHIPQGGMGDLEHWVDRRGKLGSRGDATIDVDAAGSRVVTAGPDATAAIWDARSGSELARFVHDSVPTACAFVPGTDMVATVTESGTVHLWSAGSGREVRRMEQSGPSYWVGASASGRYVLSASGTSARVWNVATGEQVARLDHQGHVDGARLSEDETLVVTYGSEIDTTVWNLASGTALEHIPVQASDGAGAAFGPGDDKLIIAAADGQVRWWSLSRAGEEFSKSVGTYVTDLAMSADHGRFVTSGTPDGTASAWSVASGQELRQMPYPMWLGAVGISADGRLMASSGNDGAGFVLDVTEIRPDDPAAAACGKVRRNLTRNEWREYLGTREPYRQTCPQIAEASEPDEG